MAGYATVTSNKPEEQEEEENTEGNFNHPEMNPIRGSRGREKENAARVRPERAGNLAQYATGLAKKPKQDE